METKNLWAPWRIDYMKRLGESGPATDDSSDCFLCEAAACEPGTDEARRRHVLRRDERGVLLMNLYPYTHGHLLVACDGHVGDLAELTGAQRAGLMELTCLGQRLLDAAINPHGFNIGINQGRCAGAGVPGHVHMHVVPRWNGDTNFLTVFGKVRVIPQALEESYDWLLETLGKMESGSD
jgi:ATP adenylyltransferase